MVDAFLNEKTYAVIDELEAIAKTHETNVASAALSWVRARSAPSRPSSSGRAGCPSSRATSGPST